MEDEIKKEVEEKVEEKVESKDEVVTREKNNAVPSLPPKRQIIIETDGNSIELKRADVAGNIELIGILQSIIEFVKRNK